VALKREQCKEEGAAVKGSSGDGRAGQNCISQRGAISRVAKSKARRFKKARSVLARPYAGELSRAKAGSISSSVARRSSKQKTIRETGSAIRFS